MFVLVSAIARGAAAIDAATGDVTQECLVTITVTGIEKDDVEIQDTVPFTVPNSEMTGESKPAVSAMEYINNTLAPQYVTDNYTFTP